MSTAAMPAPQQADITGTINASDAIPDRVKLIGALQEMRSHGYSDNDIVSYLAKDKNYGGFIQDAAAAKYQPKEIVDHLLGPYAPDQPTGNSIADQNAEKTFGQGLYDSTLKGIGEAIQQPIKAPQQHLRDMAQSIQSGDYAGAAKHAFLGGLSMGTFGGSDKLADTAKTQWDQFEKAASSLTDPEGGGLGDRIMTALGHTAAGLIPIVGPAAAKVGEDLGTGVAEGHPAYGLGEATGLIAPALLGGPVSRAIGKKLASSTIGTPTITPQLDPSEAEAVKWMKDNNIPVDAATATGSPVIRNIQALLQNSIGTSGAAKAFTTAQKSALEGAGNSLASSVSPVSATPETAGAGVKGEIGKSISDLSTKAGGAYTRLENIQNAAGATPVQVGTKLAPPPGGIGSPVRVPIMKDILAPVDISSAKSALAPIERELSEVLTPAQQQFSKGLTAIRGVLNAPDAIPASAADRTLSGLKAIMREDVPAQTKYLIGKVIDQVSPQVDAAVSKLGPAATQALQDGRALTRAKYAAQGTLDALSDEPVRLWNQLTQAKDANVNLLRDVATKAPSAMPAVARSVLDGLIDKAYADVEQAKPGSALTEWNKLGPGTKEILFPDSRMRSALDNFFNATKMVAKNPNPSGSGFIVGLSADGGLLVNAPHVAVPYIISRSALGRLLFSPGAAAALTEGMKIPIGSTAKNALVAGRILQLAGQDARLSESGQSQRTDSPASAAVQ